MTTDEWVWLRHPATGGVQYVPPSAVPVWRDIGWEPCDAPSEPNPALDEYIPLSRPAPVRAVKKTTPPTDVDPTPKTAAEAPEGDD